MSFDIPESVGVPAHGAGTVDIYHRVFDKIPDALIVVDQGGRITEANASTGEMFGYADGELVGQEIEILIPERFALRHTAYRSCYLNAPTMRHMGASRIELLARRKDAVEFPVDVMLAPLDSGEEMFVLCAVRNITDHKYLHEQLRRRTADLEKLHNELKELATRDALTGLPNRRTF